MPNGDVISQNAGGVCIDVHGGIVLNVRAGADSDRADVAAQHASVEDAGIGADFYVSDDGCIGGDPRGGVDFWGVSVDRDDQRLAGVSGLHDN